MEDALHGSWGKEVFEVDAAGGIVRELVDQHVDPVAGHDIQLTIDLDVQQYAEQALRDQAPATPQPAHRHRRPGHRRPQPDRPEEARRASARLRRARRSSAHQEWIQYKAPAGAVVVEDNSNGADHGDGQLPTVRQPLDGRRSTATSSTSCSARRSIRTPARPTPTSRCWSTAPCRAGTTSARRSSRSSPGRRCTAA